MEAIKSVLQRLFSSSKLVVTRRDVCVLALYRGQVRLLAQCGLGVEVATIDSYQGRENSLVIVSTVRARGRLGETQSNQLTHLIIIDLQVTLTTPGD